MPPKNEQKWASQEDWDAHKPIICRLYRDEDRTLKDTMKIMERDYNFRATDRMYKHRIKQWELYKNFKASEVAEILRTKRQRDAIHKPSEFIIRGQRVDMQRIENYVRSNPSVLAQAIELDAAPNRGPPSVVVCRTPSPILIPAAAGPLRLNGESGLSLLNNVLGAVVDYTIGVAERKLPVFPSETYQRALKDWCQCAWLCVFEMETAMDATHSTPLDSMRNAMVRSFTRLNLSLDVLSRNFHNFARDPRFLGFLIALTLRSFRHPESVSYEVARHLWRLGCVTVGQHHPVTQLCYAISVVDPSDRKWALCLIHRSLCNELEKQPGVDMSLVSDVYGSAMLLGNDSECNIGVLGDMIGGHADFVERVTPVTESADESTSRSVLLRFAPLAAVRGDVEKTEAIVDGMQQALVRKSNVPEGPAWEDVFARIYCALQAAKIRLAQGDEEAARRLVDQGFDGLPSIVEPDEPLTETLLTAALEGCFAIGAMPWGWATVQELIDMVSESAKIGTQKG